MKWWRSWVKLRKLKGWIALEINMVQACNIKAKIFHVCACNIYMAHIICMHTNALDRYLYLSTKVC